MTCRTVSCIPAFWGLLGTLAPIAGSGQEPVLARLPVPGIEHAAVLAFAQDSLGALWLGTDRGLFRFDGAATERYVSDPEDPRSLPRDHVYGLSIGHNGMLWACTPGGLFRMDPITGEHARVLVKMDDGPARAAECLRTAPSATGQWAFVGGLGALHIAYGDSVLRPVPSTSKPVRASSGVEMPDGRLWYCDRSALRLYDPRTRQEEVFPCAPFGEGSSSKILFVDLFVDRFDPHALWCGSWGAGMIKFDTRTRQFTPHMLRQPVSGLQNIVFGAAQEGPGQWLVCLDDSIHRFSAADGFRTPALAAARAAFRTPHGHMLVGGSDGVQVLAGELDGIAPIGGALTGSNLTVVPDFEDGGYWAVRYYTDRVLMHTDGNGRLLQELPFPAGSRAEPFLITVARHGTEQGVVWVGSTRGLWRYRPGTAALEQVPLAVNSARAGEPTILAILEGDDGVIWLALGTLGVGYYDPRTGTSGLVKVDPGVLVLDVQGLDRLDNEHLLAVQRHGPPQAVALRKKQMAPLPMVDHPPPALADVAGGVVTREGDIILHTIGHGLKRLRRSLPQDGATNPVGSWRLDRSWYLPARPVFEYSAVDGRGRVWFTSDLGVYLLDPTTGVIRTLDALHGVKHRFNTMVARAPNGDIVLNGGDATRARVALEPRHEPLRLVVRRVTVNDSVVTASFARGEDLIFPHDRNSVTVAFGCIALLEGPVFNYSYNLVRNGSEGGWRALGEQRSVNLLELAPGAYELQLRAEGSTVLPVTTAIGFTIAPPWWATWWARALMIVAGVAAIILITRQVLNVRYKRQLRELERQREVERVRMRIARDVHDGIGSGLTKITMLSRQLHGEAGHLGERIAAESTELVNELGEIVWTVDPRNDSFSSFVAFVRSTLGKQFEHLPVELVSDLSCAAEDAALSIGPEVKRNVMLTLKEAVNNALKHSGATRIEVRMRLARERVSLSVRDNGQGFDPAKVREGANGLINFGKRAEAIGGQARVTSSPEGTTVAMEALLTPGLSVGPGATSTIM